MKRRPVDQVGLQVPADLKAGCVVSTWAYPSDLDALAILEPGHPARPDVVRRAMHGAWWRFCRARDAWLADQGMRLHEVRRLGHLQYRYPRW